MFHVVIGAHQHKHISPLTNTNTSQKLTDWADHARTQQHN